MYKKLLFNMAFLLMSSSALIGCSYFERTADVSPTAVNASEPADNAGNAGYSENAIPQMQDAMSSDEERKFSRSVDAGMLRSEAEELKMHKSVGGRVLSQSELKRKIIATDNVESQNQGLACIEIQYVTQVDKIQTLGYIKKRLDRDAGSVDSDAKVEHRTAQILHGHHEEVKKKQKTTSAHTGTEPGEGKKIIRTVRGTRVKTNAASVEKPVRVESAPVESVDVKEMQDDISSKQQNIAHGSFMNDTTGTARASLPQNAEPAATMAPPPPPLVTPNVQGIVTPAPQASQSQPPVDLPQPKEVQLSARISQLDYGVGDIELTGEQMQILDTIISELQDNPKKVVKLQSYSYVQSGNTVEARRNALQRAIKVRKYLIDKEVNASRISVNAIEDTAGHSNKIELLIEAGNGVR